MPGRTTTGVALAVLLLTACNSYGDMPPYDGTGGTEADVEVADEPLEEPAEEIIDEPVEETVDDPGFEPHPDCIEEQTPVLSPGHAPGTLCVSCHVMYLPFITVGGTLYTDDTGSGPVMGATILVTDSLGTEAQMITTLNGNFYTDQALTPPLTVAASKCPFHRVMTTAATSGECNSCHRLGTRMHLP